MNTPEPLVDRFWRFVVRGKPTACWLWQGGQRNQFGYGQLRVGRRGPCVGVHRLSYEIHHGKIPENLLVLHRCDTPSCVNPRHLYVGTHQDNARDCIKRGRRARGCSLHVRVRKLTDDQVRAIRKDTAPVCMVAHDHGVSESAVYNIRARRRKGLVPD